MGTKYVKRSGVRKLLIYRLASYDDLSIVVNGVRAIDSMRAIRGTSCGIGIALDLYPNLGETYVECYRLAQSAVLDNDRAGGGPGISIRFDDHNLEAQIRRTAAELGWPEPEVRDLDIVVKEKIETVPLAADALEKRRIAQVAKDRSFWDDLNKRQRHFLSVIYDRERAEARYYLGLWGSMDDKKAGGEWRWLSHNLAGGLCRDLDDSTSDKTLQNNQGSGSTYESLEERGMLERRWRDIEDPRGGTITILDVRLTVLGRRVAKTAKNEGWKKPE